LPINIIFSDPESIVTTCQLQKCTVRQFEMNKKIAIVQSNYIPWKGYFHLIDIVDEFILFDEVQYTKKSWRNRNCIKTPKGPLWLSIPVRSKGRFAQKISEVEIADSRWRGKHWKTIEMAYRNAPFFEMYRDDIAVLYATETMNLSRNNRLFLEKLCLLLGITTTISTSTDYNYVHENGSIEKIANLVLAAAGKIFINGPTAKAYMNERQFADYGITLQWMNYSGYAKYPQLHPPFMHEVSMLDMLFNCGASWRDYLRGPL
jgi:hypothetical protein